MNEAPDIMQNADDICFGFAFEGAPVRGQIVSLGPATCDEILSRHNLPHCISEILGELLVCATIAGSSLKFDGKLIVELRKEHGRRDLPVEFIVAEFSTDNTLRGMAKINDHAFFERIVKSERPSLKTLFGEGFLLLTLDQGNYSDRYQGQVSLDGESLSNIIESYFLLSEQIPTRILIGCESVNHGTSHSEWHAKGIMIQQIAGDSKRGETDDDWNEAVFKFETLGRDELLDNDISAGNLLLRLYHENKVRVYTPNLISARCNCSRGRLIGIMSQFSNEERSDMLESDGNIHARCEFCNTNYIIKPDEIPNKSI